MNKPKAESPLPKLLERALLGHVPLFASLPDAELDYLAANLENRSYPAGTVLFREGERGDLFYVILAGRLEIVKALGEPAERLVAVRQPGEFVGEMSLMHREGVRTASVRAASRVEVKLVSRAEFDRLLSRYPSLAYEMAQVLSRRLGASHELAMQELQEKNRRLRAAYEELQAAQQQLVEKEKLERELELAYEIQMSILPQRLPDVPGYRLEAEIRPARAVGGDFYDFFPLDGDRIGVVIGDVTDKGVPAAIYMARCNALLRAEATRGYSPEETLRRVNRHLLEMDPGGAPAGGMFATVLYGILDRASGEFHYARAGHELPLLCLPGGAAVELELQPGVPLGMMAGGPLDANRITLPPGGVLLFYTDGVPDGRNPADEPFGVPRLAAALADLVRQGAPDLCRGITARLGDHMDGMQPFDDITLVAIRTE